MLARLDQARAWDLFRDALVADLDDTQGGTTAEGVDLGAMAGTVDIVTRPFAAMALADGHVRFSPHSRGRSAGGLSDSPSGHGLNVEIDHTVLRLRAPPGPGRASRSTSVA